ncbi:S8 family serine peptidase [Nocardioides sp. URHA0020]|uniref:S8 family serine peptidase n=1 Tax=Nocardioides sp. URHA0020 TaxID=1380392 RepID=UPI00048C4C60|nr:S8 family serine peptidase [Nocardioides sp. URHA0020]
MRLTSALVAAVALGGVGTSLIVTAPAYAVDNPCLAVEATTPAGDTGRASAPYELLGMAAAQDQVERFAPPRATAVRVAVLSSGVHDTDGAIRVAGTADESGVGGEVTDPQGTEVAGLVAGAERDDEQPVGIAPDAQVVDVRVYVNRSSNEPREQPSTPNLARGLSWVASHARQKHIKVAVVPFVVRSSSTLRAAVKAVQAKGVVVVAASGDRPAAGAAFSSEFEDPPAKDEDAAELYFPAGYDGVVAANATGTGDPAGALASVVKNSRTTVATPTYDAVSYGLNGHTCLVQPTSTAAAAGVVAGVVALLWQRFPDDAAAQVVSRLVNTADGTTDDPTPLTGAGIVQPYEALTRPLAPERSGEVERTVVQTDDDSRVTAPEPATDLLASTRHNAVWWGLIGGGLLVVALMLRPVLARRRRG